MGIAVGRIEREFIIKSAMDKELDVMVHGNKTQINAKIVDYTERYVSLEKSDGSNWVEIGPEDSIRIYISYFGHVMTFETDIEELETHVLKVHFPTSLVKNLQRKFERVPPPEGIHCSFVMKGSEIVLDFPKTEEYNPATKPEVEEEFDTASISELVSTFKSKVSDIVSTNAITMFREREPETLEERLITRYGRSLYIPSCRGNFLIDEPVPGCPTITRNMIIKVLREEGTQDANMDVRLRMILDDKWEQGINSEIYTPVLYHEYAVGYIYLANTGERKSSISENILEYSCQFSKVLAYSLKMHNYFKEDTPKPIHYDANIIDISASGMLFAHSSPELSGKLVLYTDFDLTLQIGPRKLNIPSRVMRKFTESNMSYYGILFLELNPEDFRFLFDYVYGRELTVEDESKWEGGAEPPEIDIFND